MSLKIIISLDKGTNGDLKAPERITKKCLAEITQAVFEFNRTKGTIYFTGGKYEFLVE
jgi:hypothetical protein